MNKISRFLKISNIETNMDEQITFILLNVKKTNLLIDINNEIYTKNFNLLRGKIERFKKEGFKGEKYWLESIEETIQHKINPEKKIKHTLYERISSLKEEIDKEYEEYKRMVKIYPKYVNVKKIDTQVHSTLSRFVEK